MALVQLELILCDAGQVQVVLHLCADDGTPLKRFCSPAGDRQPAGSPLGRQPSFGCGAPGSPGCGDQGSCSPRSAASNGSAGASCPGSSGPLPASLPPAGQPADSDGLSLAERDMAAAAQAAAAPAESSALSAAENGVAGGGKEEQEPALRPQPSLQAQPSGTPCGYSSELLLSVARMLQQLADADGAAPAQAAVAEQAAAAPGQPWPSQDVERLLGLELEVVRLQQALKILQLEFQARAALVESLELRLQEAQSQAAAAEERAAHAAGALQQLLAHCRQLEAGKAEAERQLQASSHNQHQAAEWRQRLMQLRQENQQLKSQINAACGALKNLGIPASKVFSRSAMAHAQLASPPDSPGSQPPASDRSYATTLADSRPATARGAPAPARPPAVPRLQLEGLAARQEQQGQQAQQAMPHAVGSSAREPEHFPSQGRSGLVQQPQEQCAAVAACIADGSAPPLIDLGSADRQAPCAADTGQALPSQDPLWAGTEQGAGGTGAFCSATEGLHPFEQQASPHLPGALGGQGAAAAAAVGAGAGASPGAAGASNGAAEGAVHEAVAASLPAKLAGAVDGLQPLSARSGGERGMIVAWRPPCLPQEGQAGQASYSQRHQQQQLQQRQHKLRASCAGSTTAAAAPSQPAQKRPPGPAAGGGKPRRTTYAQVEAFQEVRQAYHAVMESEEDEATRWARNMLSSRSAVESNPARVEAVMQGLIQLFQEAGVDVPLRHTGPCQYALGSAKLVVRLVNGRLMARSGSGNVDIFAWLAKQPAAAQRA